MSSTADLHEMTIFQYWMELNMWRIRLGFMRETLFTVAVSYLLLSITSSRIAYLMYHVAIEIGSATALAVFMFSKIIILFISAWITGWFHERELYYEALKQWIEEHRRRMRT